MARLKARRTDTMGTDTKARKRSALSRRATAALDTRTPDAVVGGKKAVSEVKTAQAQIEAALADLQSVQGELQQSPPKP